MIRYLFILFFVVIISGCLDRADEIDQAWNYEFPDDKGLNGAALLAMDKLIKEGRYGEVHSIMIWKDGSTLFENYYNGHSEHDLNKVERITQSFFSMTMERMLSKTDLTSNDKIIDLFPEYSYLFEDIPQKDKITVEHLIYHRSGFWWNDRDLFRPYDENDHWDMMKSPDWLEYVLSSRIIREPGMEFNFNSGHNILLSAILEKELDGGLEKQIYQAFFEPMDIQDWEWEVTPNGYLNADSGLGITTRDMTKFGILFLQNGRWKDSQLVSEEWMQEIKNTILDNNYYNIGLSWYRYDFLHPAIEGYYGTENYIARGLGGNYIIVFPEYELVMVFNGKYQNNREELIISDILKTFILPALRQESTT